MDTTASMNKPQAGESSAETALAIFTVPSTHIDKAWKAGANKLAFGLTRYQPESTADQLKYRLARGELILLALAREGEDPTAWAAVSFIQYPQFRSLFIYSIFAPRQSISSTFDLLKEWALNAGASAIEGQADEAVAKLWERKFGFSEVSRTVRLFM